MCEIMEGTMEKKDKELKQFLQFVRSLAFILLILWLTFTFAVGIKMVPNDDMSPSLNAGDIMMYYRIGNAYGAQDVIVFKKNGTEYVGRIVAKGGDTVEITKEENLVINGNMVTEDKIYSSTPMYEGFQDYPVTLASDEFFVLSDERQGGEDSRYFGAVNESEVKGIVIGLFRRGGF